MYFRITKSFFKSKKISVIVPYLSIGLLLMLFVVISTLAESYKSYIGFKINFNEFVLVVDGKTNKIEDFDVYLRLKEEVPEATVIPFNESNITIGDNSVQVIGTSNSYFELMVDYDASNSQMVNISGDTNIINNDIVINKALNRIIDDNIDNYIMINDLTITAIVDDHSDLPRIYMDYKLFDVLIEKTHEELIDGSFVYKFDKLHLIYDEIPGQYSIRQVYEILNLNTNDTKFNIFIKRTLVGNQLSYIGVHSTLNKSIGIIVLITFVLVSVEVLKLSIRRRRNEFNTYMVLGVSKIRIVWLSMIENLITLGLIATTSALLGIIVSFVVIRSFGISKWVINFNCLFLGYLTLIITIVVLNILFIGVHISKNELQRRMK